MVLYEMLLTAAHEHVLCLVNLFSGSRGDDTFCKAVSFLQSQPVITDEEISVVVIMCIQQVSEISY